MKKIILQDKKFTIQKRNSAFFVHEKNSPYKTLFYKPLDLKKVTLNYSKPHKTNNIFFMLYARRQGVKSIQKKFSGKAYEETKKILYGRYLKKFITRMLITKKNKVLTLSKENIGYSKLKFPLQLLERKESIYLLSLLSGVAQFSQQYPRMNNLKYNILLQGFYNYRKLLIDDFLRKALKLKTPLDIIREKISLEEIYLSKTEDVVMCLPYLGPNKIMTPLIENWELTSNKSLYLEAVNLLELLEKGLKTAKLQFLATEKCEQSKTSRTFREHFVIPGRVKTLPSTRSVSSEKVRARKQSNNINIPYRITEIQNRQQNVFKIKLRGNFH